MGRDKGFLEIHTSDRLLFKRCRRKWDFQSRLRRNLVAAGEVITPLWFGTGFHFALEQFHGHNTYGSPAAAFDAYYNANLPDERPVEGPELLELAHGMFDHYERWLKHRNEFATLWLFGKPMLEVSFDISLPQASSALSEPVCASGKLDGLYIDAEKRIWIAEYKTAIQVNTAKLDLDTQVSAYVWAAGILLNQPEYREELKRCYGIDEPQVEGVVYLQFKKDVPKMPKRLKNGSLSTNKAQLTTHALYREELLKDYGSADQFPPKYVEMLNHLLEGETPDGDKFINRTLVRRNAYQIEAEYETLELEALEMLSEPTIYTNPTRDCAWDCPFRQVCVAQNDGSDWRWLLDNCYGPHEELSELWQTRLEAKNTESSDMTLSEALKSIY